MGCKCAPACKKALADATLKWPTRNRASDGCCGDEKHRARKSDHNPDASGYAHAFDLTHDPANGVDCNVIAEQVKTDPRVTYVIWSGRIYKARTGKWETYTGPNKHNHHCHVSIHAYAREDLSPWPFSPDGATPAPAPALTPRTLKLELPNLTGPDVLRLQQALNAHGASLDTDSVFGIGTDKAVKRFQRENGLDVDGKVGPATRKALGL